MRAPAISPARRPLRWGLALAVLLLAATLSTAVASADEANSESQPLDDPTLANALGDAEALAIGDVEGAPTLAGYLASGELRLSADVALSGLDEAAEPVVGSFTVDGLTYAVVGEGQVALVAVAPSTLAGDLAGASADDVAGCSASDPSDGSSGAEGATRGIGSGVPPRSVAEQVPSGATSPQPLPAPSAEADGSDMADGESGDALASATLSLPEAIPYNGVSYALVAVGSRALSGCSAATVVLPASVESVDEAAFCGSSVQAIEVAEGNPNFSSYDGMLFSADQSSLLLIPEGKQGAARIPETASSVPPSAFSHSAYVTSVEVEAGSAAFTSRNGCLYDAMGELVLSPPAAIASLSEAGSFSAGEGVAYTLMSADGIAPSSSDRYRDVYYLAYEDAGDGTHTITGPMDVRGGVYNGHNFAHPLTSEGWNRWYGRDEHGHAIVRRLMDDGTTRYYLLSRDNYTPTITSSTGYRLYDCPAVSWGSAGFSEVRLNQIWDNQTTDISYWLTLEGSRKVVFNGNGGLVSVQSFNEVSTATAFYGTYPKVQLPTPVRAGYRFVGWFADRACTSLVYGKDHLLQSITSDMTLYAGWEQTKVTFDPSGGTLNYYARDDATGKTVLKGTYATSRTWGFDGKGEINGSLAGWIYGDDNPYVRPTRAAYDLVGWTGSATVSGSTVRIMQNGDSYRAQWTPTTYAISYELGGGELAGATSTDYSYTVETPTFALRTPKKAGFTFAGWTVGSYSALTGGGISSSGVTTTVKKGTYGNLVFTAQWTQKVATFDPAGGSFAQYKIDAATNKHISLGTTTERLVARFNGAGQMSTTRAGWLIDDVNYYIDPKRNGYDPMGWTGTAEVSAGTGTVNIASGGTYKVKWAPKSLRVTYDLRGGVLPAGVENPEGFTVESASFVLKNPVRLGFSFAGWEVDDYGAESGGGVVMSGTTATVQTGVYTDLTFKATWIQKTALFDAQGGLFVEKRKDLKTGETVVLRQDRETVTVGWNGAGEIASSLAGWILNEGTVAVYNDSLTPTRKGYRHTGWTGSATLEEGSAKVPMADKGSYKATWEAIEYKITYHLAEGAAMPEGAKAAYTVEDADYAVPAPRRPEHYFAGWTVADDREGGVQVSGTRATIKQGTAGDVELSDSWKQHTADFDANGGTFELKRRDTTTNVTTTLQTGLATYRMACNMGGRINQRVAGWNTDVIDNVYNDSVWASKTGYTQVGWTGSEEVDATTGERSIVDGGSYKARWQANAYAIRLDANGPGASVEPAEVAAAYDGPVELPEPSRYGYAFAGWDTAPDGTGTRYGSGANEAPNLTAEANGTATLYAQWALVTDVEVPIALGSVGFELGVPDGQVRAAGADGAEAAGWLRSAMPVPVAVDSVSCEAAGDGASDPASPEGFWEAHAAFADLEVSPGAGEAATGGAGGSAAAGGSRPLAATGPLALAAGSSLAGDDVPSWLAIPAATGNADGTLAQLGELRLLYGLSLDRLFADPSQGGAGVDILDLLPEGEGASFAVPTGLLRLVFTVDVAKHAEGGSA